MSIYCRAECMSEDKMVIFFTNGRIIKTIEETETFKIIKDVIEFNTVMNEIIDTLTVEEFPFDLGYQNDIEWEIEIDSCDFDKFELMLNKWK